MPFHFRINISVLAYKIDSWDNEKFWLFIDGVIIYE